MEYENERQDYTTGGPNAWTYFLDKRQPLLSYTGASLAIDSSTKPKMDYEKIKKPKLDDLTQ